MGLCGNAYLPWYIQVTTTSSFGVSLFGYLFSLYFTVFLAIKGHKINPEIKLKCKTLKIKMERLIIIKGESTFSTGIETNEIMEFAGMVR